jgi:hypothetical protein
MKTSSLYGFISALAGALLVLVLYFLGYHSDPAKFTSSKWIAACIGLAIVVVVMVLGVRARRSETPQGKGFGYGTALLAGFQIALVSSVLSAAFVFAYDAVINPGFRDIIVQDAMEKVQASGMSGPQLDQVEKVTRFMASPAMRSVSTLVGGVIIGFILALIVAAFVRRPEPSIPPPV